MRCVLACLLGLPGIAGAFESLETESGHAVRWMEMPVTYAVAFEGPALMASDLAEDTVDEAFANWAETADLEFESLGPTSTPGTDFHPDRPEDAVNTVHFGGMPMADGQLAFTVVRFDEDSGAILNAHIFVDQARHEFGPNGPAFDLQSTLTHEVGHFLGFGHSDDHGSMMHSGLARGDVRALDEDDVEALRAVYGQRASGASEARGGCQASTGGFPWFWCLLACPRRRR